MGIGTFASHQTLDSAVLGQELHELQDFLLSACGEKNGVLSRIRKSFFSTVSVLGKVLQLMQLLQLLHWAPTLVNLRGGGSALRRSIETSPIPTAKLYR